jgi:hypothetical protein
MIYGGPVCDLHLDWPLSENDGRWALQGFAVAGMIGVDGFAPERRVFLVGQLRDRNLREVGVAEEFGAIVEGTTVGFGDHGTTAVVIGGKDCHPDQPASTLSLHHTRSIHLSQSATYAILTEHGLVFGRAHVLYQPPVLS